MSSVSRAIFVRAGKFVDRWSGRILEYRRWAISGFCFYCTASLVNTYLWENNFGDGPSMYPTVPDGNHIAGNNKLYKHGKGIQVGDVVQVWSPVIPGVVLGKRIIGLPGDYILKSKSHSPAPGGAPMPGITDWKKKLDGSSALAQPDEEEWEEPEMIRVPEGHAWIEGDNQAWSKDSRDFGPVPLALIISRSSWIKVGNFEFRSLKPGRGLRKLEENEIPSVLGQDR